MVSFTVVSVLILTLGTPLFAAEKTFLLEFPGCTD